MQADPALCLSQVVVRHGDTLALGPLDLRVGAGERWVVIGPNGCGKTTLVRVATGYQFPTSGRASVVGHVLGRVDVRELRRQVGLASAAVSRLLRPEIPALEAVLSARHAALETWWHEYSADDRSRAEALLEAVGLAGAAERPFGALSEGERQQVVLARTLMQDPGLLLLDEPAAGLDLGARERLLRRLADLAADPSSPAMIFITHHVEEIPPGFTHALILRDGQAIASGPIAEVLTSESISTAFGLPVDVERAGGRYSARAVDAP